MPIYEFACERCGTRFETLVRRPSEKAPCPACGARKTRKRFSVFGIPGGASSSAEPATAPAPRPT